MTSARPIGGPRLVAIARSLLNASSLCAIATVSPGGQAHVNTAYFAWSRDFDLVWLSAPQSIHSRNVRTSHTVAVAVYDSAQSWGNPDRGIQLFGSAHDVKSVAARDAERIYARRFPGYARPDFDAYRFYLFRPRRVKVFDERALGAGVFVTAMVASGGRLNWERTDTYRANGGSPNIARGPRE